MTPEHHSAGGDAKAAHDLITARREKDRAAEACRVRRTFRNLIDRRLDSCASVALGDSWLDGRPCQVMEYPAGTPLFGNVRDELRELSPGLWLGMYYEREPHPKLRGYFALELEADMHPDRR